MEHRRSGKPSVHQARPRGRHQFLRHGQRLFGWKSEEILGRALKDFAHRDEVVIATKVNGRMRPGPNGGGLSRKAIMREIDASLRRLGTDYVDLYRIHRWDHHTPIEETLEALHDVVRAGKARYIGAIVHACVAICSGSSQSPNTTAGHALSACRN